MIKLFFYTIIFVLFLSCQKEQANPEHLPDEYVLIEFAASLEDEYEKLYPEEKKIIPEPPKEVPAKAY